jgi:hypothetical protein
MSRPDPARDERLRSFLATVRDTPFIWGESDCCSFALQWIERETGRTIEAPSYRTEDEAHRLIVDAGGLAPLLRPIAQRGGLAECSNPEPGDVGVIKLGNREFAAIFVHGGIAVVRTIDAWRFLPTRAKDILAVWSM